MQRRDRRRRRDRLGGVAEPDLAVLVLAPTPGGPVRGRGEAGEVARPDDGRVCYLRLNEVRLVRRLRADTKLAVIVIAGTPDTSVLPERQDEVITG